MSQCRNVYRDIKFSHLYFPGPLHYFNRRRSEVRRWFSSLLKICIHMGAFCTCTAWHCKTHRKFTLLTLFKLDLRVVWLTENNEKTDKDQKVKRGRSQCDKENGTSHCPLVLILETVNFSVRAYSATAKTLVDSTCSAAKTILQWHLYYLL